MFKIRNEQQPILIKAIATLEILGGVFGIVISVLNLLYSPKSSLLDLIITPLSSVLFVMAFAFTAYAGYKLWRKSLLGIELSLWAQAIQLPWIVVNRFDYHLYSGIAFNLVYTGEDFKRVIGVGGAGAFGFGGAGFQAIGINLIALFFLLYLSYYYHEMTRSSAFLYKVSKILIQKIKEFSSIVSDLILKTKIVKAIALLEVLGGVLGLGSTIVSVVSMEYHSINNDHTILLPLRSLIYMGLYFLVAYAGYRLWQNKIRGYTLSIIAQALQIPSLITSDIHYKFVSLVGLFLGCDEEGFLFSMDMGSHYLIGLTAQLTGSSYVGFNLLAILLMLYLVSFYQKNKLNLRRGS